MREPPQVLENKPLEAVKTAKKAVNEPAKKVGLSSCENLHARFVVKTYGNGEIISYSADLTENQKVKLQAQNGCSEILTENISTGEPGTDLPEGQDMTDVKPSSPRGEHKQSGLTSYAKRCMRILAHEYQKKIDEPGSTARSCSFTTLSFRRILPSNDGEGKAIFRAYKERIRRARGNIRYVWVAEKQEGKVINGKESYRLKNKQSVIHFHLLSPEQMDMEWVNVAWNEVCMNHFLQTGQITPIEWQQWQNELKAVVNYCRRLEKWNKGQRKTRPRQPDKSEFLLTPNVTGVYNASHYMSKYISKEKGKIPGHLWGMDRGSKKLCEPEVKEIYFQDEYEAYHFAEKMNSLLVKTKKHIESEALVFNWHDYTSNLGIWCSDKALFQGCFATLVEQSPEIWQPTKRNRKKTTILKEP